MVVLFFSEYESCAQRSAYQFDLKKEKQEMN